MRSRFGRDPDGQINLFGGSRIPAKLRRRKGERRPPDETALVARLIVWAAARHERLVLERVNCGSAWKGGRPIRLAPEGTPDLKGQMRGELAGQCFVAEVKVGDNPCSAAQRRKLRDAIERGEWAFVVRDTVESFVAQLEAAEAGRYAPPPEIFE